MAGKISEYPAINTLLFPTAGDLFDVSQITAIVIFPPSITYESRKVTFTQLAAALGDGNIYTEDGTLTANRTATMSGFNLAFDGGKTAFKGAGATSATKTVTILNSASTEFFTASNNVRVGINKTTPGATLNVAYYTNDDVFIAESSHNSNAIQLTAPGVLNLNVTTLNLTASVGVVFTNETANTAVYLDAGKNLISVPAGSDGDVLTLVSGVPAWSATTGGESLAATLAIGNATNELHIVSNNGMSRAKLLDTNANLTFDDGTNYGYLTCNTSQTVLIYYEDTTAKQGDLTLDITKSLLQHTDAVDLVAPVITLTGDGNSVFSLNATVGIIGCTVDGYTANFFQMDVAGPHEWQSGANLLLNAGAELHLAAVTDVIINGAKNINLGQVELRAGTATANTAPLKFTSGTNLTVAVAGVMEYDGTNFFATRTAGNREVLFSGQNAATAPGVNSIGVITDYYGTSATRVLTTPDSWASININGTAYRIPLYIP
jgi:hypothetical protein